MISFDLNRQQQEWQAKAREFALEEIGPGCLED